MGKRILAQRKGRGGSVFTSPRWIHIGPAKYPNLGSKDTEETLEGRVEAILHDPGRGVPLALIKLSNGLKFYNIAAERLKEGQRIQVGGKAELAPGNILPLKSVPDGTKVFNVELDYGDGGRIVRSSGCYAVVLGHAGNNVYVSLPSGKTRLISGFARATIGVAAGGGRTEKPFVKAGAKYHLSKVKAWKYPEVRGKAMGAYAHPHGGGSHPKGGTPVTHGTPPGAKVGHISSRRTGRRK
ncbi:MAG: 50S ribosomal protein L2 [Candidatus Nezhaarchaeota archaeon]|nr:50S ribosomal protein L2 [Candidatus Nezhaarchaeota archaeon]